MRLGIEEKQKEGLGGVLLFVCRRAAWMVCTIVCRRAGWMLFLLEERNDPEEEACADYCGEDLSEDGGAE